MIRTLICDDHDLVRTAIARVLETQPGIDIIGQASNVNALWHRLRAGPTPDLLIVDLSFGPNSVGEGIRNVQRIVEAYPTLHIIVLSMHSEPEVAARVFEAGAMGFVAKGSPMEILLQGIRHVQDGQRYLDPRVIDGLLRPAAQSTKAWDAELTPRERDVMARLCAGQRLSDIAVTMAVSVKTISTHKMRLMEKLQVRNNAELIRLGQSHGLV